MSASKTIVCRCEDVTVHDIETAIEGGHCDLESIKRYTGLATGWCQGKHCLAACARAIVKAGGELPNLPITPRPPFHPVSFAHLAGLGATESQSGPLECGSSVEDKDVEPRSQ